MTDQYTIKGRSLRPVEPLDDTAALIATIQDFMRNRQRELREEADRLHESGAKLDAWSRKLVADELDHCCRMLNKLEFQFRHIPQASRPHPVCLHDQGHEINGVGMWVCLGCRADITPNA